MGNLVLMFAFLVFVGLSACAVDIFDDGGNCEYEDSRNAVLSSAGVKMLQIQASAGDLFITGSSDSAKIIVDGKACASSPERLDAIKILTSQQNNTATVVTDLSGSGNNSRLDLSISIPDSISVDIIDGSGNVTIENLFGNAYIADGSGNIHITNVTGELRLTDGSGNIHVLNNVGNVVVEDDGSGNIDIMNTVGNVIIEEDGSGNVSVGNVQGDFIFKRDGSGSVSHWNVSGKVALP